MMLQCQRGRLFRNILLAHRLLAWCSWKNHRPCVCFVYSSMVKEGALLHHGLERIVIFLKFYSRLGAAHFSELMSDAGLRGEVEIARDVGPRPCRSRSHSSSPSLCGEHMEPARLASEPSQLESIPATSARRPSIPLRLLTASDLDPCSRRGWSCQLQ